MMKESKILFEIYKRIAFMLPPEVAHNYTLSIAEFIYSSHIGQFFKSKINQNPVKKLNILFPNHLGLAAGFDKNGDFLNFLSSIGFGFIEIGTVTPKPQSGNKKPRVFRLIKDNAVINHLGFNNKGILHLKKNLISHLDKKTIPIGVNIGKNANTHIAEAHEDYIYCMNEIYEFSDYLTINISSPNTKDLRSLHHEERLSLFLEKIKRAHDSLEKKYNKITPLFLKISPDLDEEEIFKICNIIRGFEIPGLIATNTSIDETLLGNEKINKNIGGISGKPLLKKSNNILAKFREQLPDQTIIGCGGIASKDDAIKKLKYGSDLLQMYTGLIYNGKKVIDDITS